MAEETLGVLELEDNLSDAEKPPELPSSKYIGEVQNVQIGTSQGKGNAYYAVTFKIDPEEIPQDLKDSYPDGATLGWNRTLVPQRGDRRALYNLRKLVESLGLDSNTTSIDPNEWMGRRAILHVGLGNLFQGERRAQINSIEVLDEGRAPAKTVVAARGNKKATEEKPARGGRARR